MMSTFGVWGGWTRDFLLEDGVKVPAKQLEINPWNLELETRNEDIILDTGDGQENWTPWDSWNTVKILSINSSIRKEILEDDTVWRGDDVAVAVSF